jgi:hypothetical protein
MSEKASAHHWLKDSGLQIISALIGSSLLVTAITTLASEINKPNLSLNVIPHYRTQPAGVNDDKIDYYEIIAKNNGKRQATNVILSAYFNGSVSEGTTFFSGETIPDPEKQDITAPQSTLASGQLLRWNISRLPPDAMIIFNVPTDKINSATKFDPYYVTAIFDEGSKTYPVFGTADIESGRFPNILAGREEEQTTQRLLVTSIILCAIFFTIAIKYKDIKNIIDKRRKGRKWSEIKFDLFLALPITMLSSILIFYICEEIPLTALLHYLIIPPLDVTDGPSLDETVSYKTVDYRQGHLLLNAFIFWGISFFARSLLSYLIAKLLINKFHEEFKEKPINTRYLALSSIFIMGAPLASTMMLFFSKSTYSISPVYLFFMFLVIDMIRMSVLVIVIPKISIKSNKPLNYGLNALSLAAGLLQLLLFVTLLRTWWTGVEIGSYFLPLFMAILFIGSLGQGQLTQMMSYFLPLFKAQLTHFLPLFMAISFISGLGQLIQMILLKLRENGKSRCLLIATIIISAALIGSWIYILQFITSEQNPVLSIASPIIIGSPIIITGIIVIVLNAAYIVLAIGMDIRKVYKVILRLDPLETHQIGKNTCSNHCFPADGCINVTGQLDLANIDNEKVKKIIVGKCITIDNGGGEGHKSKFNAKIENDGRFQHGVKAPSYVGSFQIKAYFEGYVDWNNEEKKNWKSNLFFTVTVVSPANSTYKDNGKDTEGPKYDTKLRNVSLSVLTGTMKNGDFTKKDEFKPRQLITFEVKLLDTEENKPISEQKDITLMLYGEDTQKVTNPLPPTDNDGKTYASIRALSIPSDGCIFKASYPGNSIYAKASSKIQTYSLKY